ncbi:MAG: hypothetical protein HYR64_02520 [Fimbriimonas ginsengisoli]|uniref:Uncharacterized protein n=1 Tax=Fimbriimonas ginsengisoli TaxID=1005039 RepID=A0A931LR70_FIMGI|nr:hypothetical protein [Fimbriimonas ginsengisoli]
MERDADLVLLRLTRDEAFELFARCLKSADEDTPESRSVLKKISQAVGAWAQREAS